MHLIIDDAIPYIRGKAERLGTCTYLPGRAITAQDVRQADALIIRTRTKVDSTLLSGSSVRFVATATIGFDHIDTEWLDAHGIAWTNCPGCNATSVAQYVTTALEALGTEDGATIGLVGCGHVGSAVARALRHHYPTSRIIACDPLISDAPVPLVTLQTLLAESDVVSLHTPLAHGGSYPTYHMADDAFFGQMRRRPVFVNAARGECMDTAAVIRAIDEGKISGTIIDTWEDEPHISPELLRRADLTTPHIAGYSADGKANGTRMALQAVAAHFGLTDIGFDDVVPPPAPPGYRYDPRTDSEALRLDPTAFESLRANYPLRRE